MKMLYKKLPKNTNFKLNNSNEAKSEIEKRLSLKYAFKKTPETTSI